MRTGRDRPKVPRMVAIIRRRKLVVAATCIAAIIALLWVKETAIWRDDEYWRLVGGYERARPVTKQPDLKEPGVFPDRWYELMPLAEGITAAIEALGSLNPSTTVRYSDSPTVYQLYPARDYTTLIDLRVDGEIIYVLRSISLIGTERRLVLFDLTSREVIADRRVDPNDALQNFHPRFKSGRSHPAKHSVRTVSLFASLQERGGLANLPQLPRQVLTLTSE
jgi:hypothetical protein